MVEKFVDKLMKKIEVNNSNMSQEKRDSIWFGLMIMFDEVPKILLMILTAYCFGILKNTLISFFSIALYRTFSGGFHAKTHIGCFILTMLTFSGNAVISKYIVWDSETIKYIMFAIIWTFNMIMINLYAPADTTNVPILNKGQRKRQKILSFITMNIVFIAGLLIKDNTISNIFIIGTFIQSFDISRLAYFIFNNKYGHEVYAQKGVIA